MTSLTLGGFSSDTSIAPSAIGLALTGLGMGFATGPLMDTAVGAVGPERSGTASALVNVARMSGAMLCGGPVQLACAAVAWRLVNRLDPGRALPHHRLACASNDDPAKSSPRPPGR